MKILEINAYYQNGSTGHIVQQLCDYGISCGYDMYAVYWLNKNTEKRPNVFYCGEESAPGIISKYSEWVLKGDNLRLHHERTKKILSCICKINPDIIHLHNLHGDFEFGSLDYIYFFSELAKLHKRVIWTLHDCWAITGRCYYFSYNNCEKWKDKCGHCPQRFYDREDIFRDRTRDNLQTKKNLYNLLDDLTIVTVSHWLQTVVEESILKGRRVVTIYNGIDTDLFKPDVKVIKNRSKFTILCIGWDRRKGYKDYFRLSRILNDDEQIIVVGKRPLFRKYNILPRNVFEIERAASSEQMLSVYRKADVYFNASPAETFGLTTIEAASCGLPVVGYDNSATGELLKTIESKDFVAKNGNIEEIKKIINQLKLNKQDKMILHNKCEKLFDDSIMLSNYFSLFDNA